MGVANGSVTVGAIRIQTQTRLKYIALRKILVDVFYPDTGTAYQLLANQRYSHRRRQGESIFMICRYGTYIWRGTVVRK